MKTIEEIKKILLLSDLNKFKYSLNEYNIYEHDKFGNDILHYYLINIKEISLDFKDIFNELLNRGIDINSKQPKGQYQRSYLQMTVVFNLKDIFDFLINKGANVKSTDANGNSILSDAVYNYFKDQSIYGYYINTLLNKGADPFQKNNYGVSAYSLAQNIANYDVKKYFENIKEMDC